MILKYLAVFFVSMVPLIELRAAVPIAIGMGLPTLPSIVVCAIGNMAPVPIIYLFARKFLVWGLDKPYIGKICHFFHDKGEAAGPWACSSLWPYPCPAPGPGPAPWAQASWTWASKRPWVPF